MDDFMRCLTLLLGAFSIVTVSSAAPRAAWAQTAEEETIKESSQVLREIMAIPGKGIPEALLSKAQGVLIVPGMFKGGFVVGVKHGDGVFLARDAKGQWQSPLFVSITGGSVGFQAGVQRTDVILVFHSKTSVEAMMKGKLTIGADASAAAGPIGRDAAAATDGQFKAEILSYSRSRGLFAGVSLDGSIINVENRANNAYYAPRPGQPAYPGSALKLIEQLASYSGGDPAPVATPQDAAQREEVRRHLFLASQRLQTALDTRWQQYLAIPLAGTVPPSPEAMKQCQARYDAIAADPQYRNLTERADFQETLRLLRSYNSMGLATNVIPLPPPPK
jgi:lipid-binding SYLF domain-containing protein